MTLEMLMLQYLHSLYKGQSLIIIRSETSLTMSDARNYVNEVESRSLKRD